MQISTPTARYIDIHTYTYTYIQTYTYMNICMSTLALNSTPIRESENCKAEEVEHERCDQQPRREEGMKDE